MTDPRTVEDLLREAGAHVGGYPMHTSVERVLAERLAAALAAQAAAEAETEAITQNLYREMAELRQRAEEAEAAFGEMGRMFKAAEAKLAEAQEREAWWREWEMMTGFNPFLGDGRSNFDRYEELRRLLGIDAAKEGK